MIHATLVIEDQLHLNVLKRILEFLQHPVEINSVLGLRGSDYIRRNLAAFNQAARIMPYIILTDLDQNECPPALIRQWIHFDLHPDLLFRIAVREAESWLLADRANFAAFLGISSALIQREPETIQNPKEYIAQLARKSRKRKIREDLAPRGTATVGKNYNTTLGDFTRHYWDIDVASQHSSSLSGLLSSLNRLAAQHSKR